MFQACAGFRADRGWVCAELACSAMVWPCRVVARGRARGPRPCRRARGHASHLRVPVLKLRLRFPESSVTIEAERLVAVL